MKKGGKGIEDPGYQFHIPARTGGIYLWATFRNVRLGPSVCFYPPDVVFFGPAPKKPSTGRSTVRGFSYSHLHHAQARLAPFSATGSWRSFTGSYGFLGLGPEGIGR